MITYQPYTYLVGWSSINKWYYGVRFAKNCQPADLWTTYFTSSKYVALLRETHGEPDIIQIRKTFTDAKSARAWEHTVLRRTRAVNNSSWINRHDGHHSFFNEIPHNKITTTFQLTCEFCNSSVIFTNTIANQTRKTCGSKRCAALWTSKYTTRTYTNFTETLTLDERKKFGNKGVANPFFGKQHPVELRQQITRKISGNYTITSPNGDVNNINNLYRYCKENNLNRDILMKHMGMGVIPEPIYKTSSVTRHNTTGYTISLLS
jgi:hypothetical protein